MSDEPEGGRFPTIVWDDFAMRAAQTGLMASIFWFPLALPHLSTTDDIVALAVATATATLVAFALSLLVHLGSTRYRHLGLAIPGATLLFAGLAVMAMTGEAGSVAFALITGGYFLGLLSVIRKYLVLAAPMEHEPELRARVRKFQNRYTFTFAMLALAANLPPLVIGFARVTGWVVPNEVAAIAFWYMFTLSAVVCVWCWLRFLRPFVELCLEPIARTLYRVKANGAGRLPAFGPCLVIANHGFWFDPCILGVILPRPITPIMTQRFYERWFLKPLLKYVFRVIVVPETPLKRKTPELEQAVAALDRGEVVVIFPEGYLRRKEEVPLRRFGQGVWHILSARPDTPVVACWIEGGWGSKFSYKDGPPTVNKPMDFRRKIDVAVSAPDTVPPEVLADQMATRIHLMNRVAGVRAELGLAPLPPFEVRQVAEHQDEPAEPV